MKPLLFSIAFILFFLQNGVSNDKVSSFFKIVTRYEENNKTGFFRGQKVKLEEDIIWGQCPSFNGESSFAEYMPVYLDSVFTISFWFNSKSLLKHNCTLVGIPDYFWVRTTTSRELQFTQPRIVDNNTSGLLLTENNWYYLTVRIHAREVSVFIDDSLVATFPWKGDFKTGKSKLLIGKSLWREFFEGKITHFEYVKHAKSNQQILDAYNSSKINSNLKYGLAACSGFERTGATDLFEVNAIQRTNYEQMGRSVVFNGSNSVIKILNTEVDNAISFSTWIRVPEMHNQYGALFSGGQSFAFRIQNNRKLLFTIPQIIDIKVNASAIPEDKWTHVGFTYLEGKELVVYQDGKPLMHYNVSEYPNAQKILHLGNDLWNDFFKGEMGNFAIWNRVISDEEMKMAASKPSAFWEQNQVRSYHFYWLYSLLLISVLGVVWMVIKKWNRRKSQTASIQLNDRYDNQCDEPIEELLHPLIIEATEVVMQHISNSDFSVSHFAEAMNRSKTKLYNELKQCCGMSGKEFIRYIRIEYAARLLTETDTPVTEIVFESGFESRAYFNKCFREKYEMTPTEYRKKYASA